MARSRISCSHFQGGVNIGHYRNYLDTHSTVRTATLPVPLELSAFHPVSARGSVESGRADEIHAVRQPCEIHTRNAVGRPKHEGTDRVSSRNEGEVKKDDHRVGSG